MRIFYLHDEIDRSSIGRYFGTVVEKHLFPVACKPTLQAVYPFPLWHAVNMRSQFTPKASVWHTHSSLPFGSRRTEWVRSRSHLEIPVPSTFFWSTMERKVALCHECWEIMLRIACTPYLFELI